MPHTATAPHDHAHHHHHHDCTRLALPTLIGALGVVYGDIGTSPLYAFNQSIKVATAGLASEYAAVMGVLSLIFWVLMLTITLKYIMFVLRADNDGEGGILALITKLRLHKAKSRPERILLLIGLFGAAMLFGDGVLTPAISVLSAAEGLQIVAPHLSHFVMPLTVAILVGVFVAQRLGTEKIGAFFGIIMMLWFSTLGALGLTWIVQAPAVLQALNPAHAFALMGNSPALSFAIFGAVFLVITGGEALYADLGHFGRKNISVAWVFIVLPALCLNYFGQGALFLTHPGAVTNPFYQMAPDWFGIPLLVLAAAASIIASQAIITGVFSLTKQAVEIGYLPPMRVSNTSAANQRHVYIDRINTWMLVATIIVVMTFKSSEALASAYGVAVAMAMVTTTILFTLWLWRISGWNKMLIAGISLLFMAFDTVFALANAQKIHEGGWLPLLIGGVIILLMVSWHRGIERLVERHMSYTELIEDFYNRINHTALMTVPKTAIFFSRSGTMAPVPLVRMTELMQTRFEKVVIISIRIASRPRIKPDERLTVTHLGPDLIKMEISYGFLQTINIPATIGTAFKQNGLDQEHALYVIGHERIVGPRNINGPRDIMDSIFASLATNAERAIDRFSLPKSRTIEFGYPVYL